MAATIVVDVASRDVTGRTIGEHAPCFVIAEAGVNHDGRLDLAHRLIDVATAAGADAVKFQTFSADRLAAPTARKAEYQLRGTPSSESQVEMLRRLELDVAAHRELAAHCRERDIVFLSTPFDEASADLLEEIGVPAFKVASGEITNLPFLVYLARKSRPIILSTGMATLTEVALAVDAIHSGGLRDLVLLHCVSCYPASPADVNLRAVRTLAAAFDVPAGYSDHTLGLEIAWAAVALGACVLEKHFTLDRTTPGPDHAASLEPEELTRLVQGIRHIEAALGHGRKEPAAAEADVAVVARKSLVATCDIVAGAVITDEMIAARRPGTGLLPGDRAHVVGRLARVAIPTGAVLTRGHLA